MIGYGKIFENLCFGKFNKKDDNLIYTGFYGLMFVTLISLITSYFTPHNFYHNLILHSFGFFYLFFNFNLKDRNFLKYKNQIKYNKNTIYRFRTPTLIKTWNTV